MIVQEFKKHQAAYLILMAGMILLSLAFIAVWPSRVWQRVVILFMCFFYFCWSVITHVKTNFITRRVLIEYLGVTCLAGISLFLLTW